MTEPTDPRPTGLAPGDPSWVQVGEAVIEETSLGGHLGHRVLLELTLPEDVGAGHYEVIVRNAAGNVPGEIIGGSRSPSA